MEQARFDPNYEEKQHFLKCSNCGCIEIGFEDNSRIQNILRNGHGLKHAGSCLLRECGCHYANANPPKLLLKTRVV